MPLHSLCWICSTAGQCLSLPYQGYLWLQTASPEKTYREEKPYPNLHLSPPHPAKVYPATGIFREWRGARKAASIAACRTALLQSGACSSAEGTQRGLRLAEKERHPPLRDYQHLCRTSSQAEAEEPSFPRCMLLHSLTARSQSSHATSRASVSSLTREVGVTDLQNKEGDRETPRAGVFRSLQFKITKTNLAFSVEQFSVNGGRIKCFTGILTNRHIWKLFISIFRISVGRHQKV